MGAGWPRTYAALAVLVAVSACSGDDPPRQGDYTLSWYPYEGTDYGSTIPGFRTLAMCRRAGAGMTIAKQLDRYGVSVDFDYSDEPKQPWFECGTNCRPYTEGGFMIVCAKIAEYHSREATVPH